MQFLTTLRHVNMMPKNTLLTCTALLSIVFLQAHSKVISASKPSDFVLQETTKWLSKTPTFQNCTSDEDISKMIDQLLSWKTTDYFVKNFPYYLSGLSYEKLPIYILEAGKYDFVAEMRQGPEVLNNVYKVVAQGIVRMLTILEHGGLDGNSHKAYFILDFDGFTYSQYNSVAAIELLTGLFLHYVPWVENVAEAIYCINGNYAMDTLYNIFRPVFGRLAERIEIYGPKKSQWLAVLNREFPDDALPPWYGGWGNFTPIATYG